MRDTVPLRQAIKAGAATVDVLCVNPDSTPQCPPGMGKTVANVRQAIDTLMSEIERNDMAMVEYVNRLVRLGDEQAVSGGKRDIKINVMRPSAWLMSDPLDFDRAKIAANIERGYADAKALTW